MRPKIHGKFVFNFIMTTVPTSFSTNRCTWCHDRNGPFFMTSQTSQAARTQMFGTQVILIGPIGNRKILRTILESRQHVLLRRLPRRHQSSKRPLLSNQSKTSFRGDSVCVSYSYFTVSPQKNRCPASIFAQHLNGPTFNFRAVFAEDMYLTFQHRSLWAHAGHVDRAPRKCPCRNLGLYHPRPIYY